MLENKMELKQPIGREIKGTKAQQTEQEGKESFKFDQINVAFGVNN